MDSSGETVVPRDGAEVSGGIRAHSKSVNIGEPVIIKWWFIPPKEGILTHTGIHYGYFSHPGELDTDVGSDSAGYSEVAIPEVILELTNFEVTISPVQKGTLFFRAHAIIDGKNYWSDERKIQVN